MGAKIPIMGKSDIGKFNSLEEQVSPDAKTRALWRTLLIKELNTSRCTTSQELQERFDQLFTLCFHNNFIPTVEALALCSGFDRRTIHDIEVRKHA